MTATLNLTQANNQDWQAEITLMNDEVSPPVVHLLKNSIVRLQLRPTPESLTVKLDLLLSLDRASQFFVSNINPDVDDGKVQIAVRAAVMRSIAAGTYAFDIILRRPTGRVYRPVAGTLILTHGVTELPA